MKQSSGVLRNKSYFFFSSQLLFSHLIFLPFLGADSFQVQKRCQPAFPHPGNRVLLKFFPVNLSSQQAQTRSIMELKDKNYPLYFSMFTNIRMIFKYEYLKILLYVMRKWYYGGLQSRLVLFLYFKDKAANQTREGTMTSSVPCFCLVWLFRDKTTHVIYCQ